LLELRQRVRQWAPRRPGAWERVHHGLLGPFHTPDSVDEAGGPGRDLRSLTLAPQHRRIVGLPGCAPRKRTLGGSLQCPLVTDTVVVRIPADTPHVALLRAAASALAARLDFPVDRITELQIAV